jgi:hypothetical protein
MISSTQPTSRCMPGRLNCALPHIWRRPLRLKGPENLIGMRISVRHTATSKPPASAQQANTSPPLLAALASDEEE